MIVLDLGQASERDLASARVDHLCVIQGWAVSVPVNVTKSGQGGFGPPRSAASECPRTTMGMACTVVHSSWKATNGGRIASVFVRAIPLSPRFARRCGADECVRCYPSFGILTAPWCGNCGDASGWHRRAEDPHNGFVGERPPIYHLRMANGSYFKARSVDMCRPCGL